MAKERPLFLARRRIFLIRRNRTEAWSVGPLNYDSRIADVHHDIDVGHVRIECVPLVQFMHLTLAVNLDSIPPKAFNYNTVAFQTRQCRLV